MPEPNEPTISPPQPKEVCSIRIMFPAASDEQALNAKRKISDAIQDIADVQIYFAIAPYGGAHRV